eukprot:m.1152109 g.1152109  ORF g.1152109 m.1152109 type:complete len:307 (-) comp24481_c0_seq58:1222-2142(-)
MVCLSNDESRVLWMYFECIFFLCFVLRSFSCSTCSISRSIFDVLNTVEGSSNLRRVQEISIDVPCFASLVPCARTERCDSQCVLPLRGIVYETQIAHWLEKEFLSPVPRLDADHTVHLRDIRNNAPVLIQLLVSSIVIETPSIALAGDLVQSMLQSLGITDLGSVASFPNELAIAQEVMQGIPECDAVGQRLSGDMSAHTALAKGLLYQAEDARVLRALGPMKEAYRNLFTLNQTILAQYKIRCNNQRDKVDSLKVLLQFIHNAARLRIGKPQVEVIDACRKAIGDDDVGLLAQAVKHGTASALAE